MVCENDDVVLVLHLFKVPLGTGLGLRLLELKKNNKSSLTESIQLL